MLCSCYVAFLNLSVECVIVQHKGLHRGVAAVFTSLHLVLPGLTLLLTHSSTNSITTELARSSCCTPCVQWYNDG